MVKGNKTLLIIGLAAIMFSVLWAWPQPPPPPNGNHNGNGNHTDDGFFSFFHTGTLWTAVSDPSSEIYSIYAPIIPHLRYVYPESAFVINSDGSTVRKLFLPNNENSFIQKIFDHGYVPIIQNWITNIDTVTEVGLRLYLKDLSTFLGQRKVIWLPCYEFNFADNYEPYGVRHWGNRGNGQSWHLNPATFNKVMGWIRNILDSESITNILLGVHMNLRTNNGLYDYMEGIRKADILGASLYVDFANLNTLDNKWAISQQVYNAIGQDKPWIFFEYGVLPWGPDKQGFEPITPTLIDRTYQKLNDYTFVRGIIWYFAARYVSSGTMTAIANNAEAYEGWRP